MDTAEERQAGQFLEQLGNRKSPIIVAALNKYLEDNPGLLDGRVHIQVHVSDLNTRMLEDKIRQLIEERLSSGVPLPAPAAANPHENVEQVSADILEMLNDLDNHNHRPCRWFAQAPLGPFTSRAYRLIESSFARMRCPAAIRIAVGFLFSSTC